MKIVYDQNIPLAQELFHNLGQIVGVDGRSLNSNSLKNADVLLVRSVTTVNADLLKETNVKWVGSATAGINHVDTKYLNSKKIPFFNAPGSNAQSVVEYVLSAIFHLKNQGAIKEQPKVGIVGFGNVGSRLARILKQLEIPFVAVDPPRKETTQEEFLEGPEVLKSCDIISFHVPFTQTGKHPTHNMIDSSFLEALNSDAVLINTCRGEILKEDDLLNSTQNFTLISDVFWDEPFPSKQILDRCLWKTPHIAGYATQAKINGTLALYEAFLNHFSLYPSQSQLVGVLPKEIDLNPVEPKNRLHTAIQASYNILEDHQRFALNPEQFDSIRKNYGIRHQFQNCRLLLPREENETWWKELGFQIG